MGLTLGVHPVAAGLLAEVVTSLEMRTAPTGALPASPLALHLWIAPELGPYRALFRRVGERWLWFSRLSLSDVALGALLSDPSVRVFTVREGEDVVGLLELDDRVPGTCQLMFVALLPELAGQGHGRWLLAEALRLAWRPGVERVTVRTCTLDHPAALRAYMNAGFTAVGREVEIFPDPRLTGLLPRSAAPHIPLIGP